MDVTQKICNDYNIYIYIFIHDVTTLKHDNVQYMQLNILFHHYLLQQNMGLRCKIVLCDTILLKQVILIFFSVLCLTYSKSFCKCQSPVRCRLFIRYYSSITTKNIPKKDIFPTDRLPEPDHLQSAMPCSVHHQFHPVTQVYIPPSHMISLK